MARANTTSRAQAMSIGVVSERTGVNIETIRYYERIGLLPQPPRSQGRHRLYDETHRQRLGFIRRARELGFSLGEVRQLLGLAGGHRLTCDAVKDITERHIADIQRKVKDLKRLERVPARARLAMSQRRDARLSDHRGSGGSLRDPPTSRARRLKAGRHAWLLQARRAPPHRIVRAAN